MIALIIIFMSRGESLKTMSDSTAVITERKAQQAKNKPKRQPRYNVILWNDDDHSYQYVVVMMKELFRYPVEKGYQIASEVDKSGRAICMTTTMELAELKRDQIHAYGKDGLIPRCKGSMSASIEPMVE
jgi:ATP-dependent Clp protease adaptor protein ClpS